MTTLPGRSSVLSGYSGTAQACPQDLAEPGRTKHCPGKFCHISEGGSVSTMNISLSESLKDFVDEQVIPGRLRHQQRVCSRADPQGLGSPASAWFTAGRSRVRFGRTRRAGYFAGLRKRAWPRPRRWRRGAPSRSGRESWPTGMSTAPDVARPCKRRQTSTWSSRSR